MAPASQPEAEAEAEAGDKSTDRLETYRAKRDFERTSEPSGAPAPTNQSATDGFGPPRFVIQKHHARRLHYDVRFEAGGVLVSWAVPKGPSLDPKVKRLAVHVEDHPLDYAAFEGTIPGGEYGAGAVIVWDQGTYHNLTEKRGAPIDIADAVKTGHLSVWLEGNKLKGGWSLTRTSRGGQDHQDQWIMVKRSDDHADPSNDITTTAPNSAVTGRSVDQVRADGTAAQWHRGQATWRPPMLAQALRVPDEIRAVDQPGWIYERKLDGLRGLAVRNGDEVELWSRNHLPFTARFPEVVAAVAALPIDNFTIDGELVAFDGERTSFALLQRPESNAQPQYHAFDVLHLLGRDTTGLPLIDRRRLLAQALDGAGERIRVVPAVEGDPKHLLEDACSHGWEGIIAKRADSTYTGGRSPDWRKLKCTASQELVVGGWTDPSGSRVGLGALLVGYYDDAGELHYAGKVGTGFADRELAELHDVLARLATNEPPFVDAERVKGAHWVRTELVAEVAFTEWTRDGRLRHPRFEGLRTDKAPTEVRRETPPA
jgi:bifunctional non-homologous end joining protein LigD